MDDKINAPVSVESGAQFSLAEEARKILQWVESTDENLLKEKGFIFIYERLLRATRNMGFASKKEMIAHSLERDEILRYVEDLKEEIKGLRVVMDDLEDRIK